MSLFDGIKKKAALKTAINQVAAAREAEGDKADALFKSAYQGFEAAIHKDLMIAEALYNWGFALLHQAKSKTDESAVALYQDAFTKFSFCLTIDPDYLGAAIDGGVALMDLARLKQVGADDSLYISAKRSFEKANKIQKGSASYNLACVHSLCHDETACLEALQNAKEHGSLPNIDDIIADPDLRNVADKAWFVEFVTSLKVIEPQLALTEKKPMPTDVPVADVSESEPASIAVETEAETETKIETAETESEIKSPADEPSTETTDEPTSETAANSFKAGEMY
jgi:tetratricopeptide (TPR) repeat protein